MPIRRAASGSSEVARNARPIFVRLRNNASAPSTPTPQRNVMSGSHPIEIWSLIVIELVSSSPT